MLAWLIQQAKKVYQWFGSGYDTMVSAIKHIGSNIAAAISVAYGKVKGWITNAVDNVKAWAKAFLDSVMSTVKGWVSTLINAVYKFIDNVKSSVKSFAEGLYSKAKDNIEDVRAFLIGLIDKGIVKLREWVKGLIKVIEDALRPLLVLLPFIVNLTRIFSSEFLNKLILLVQGLFDVLFNFVSNPLGFMFATLWGRIVDFVLTSLAYELGTVERTLPPKPRWTFGTLTGVIGSISPTGELTAPLASVYVSGYTFEQSHKGVDLGLMAGQPVYAMHSGKVISAGWSSVGYGNQVVIDGGKYWSRYAHLQSIGVKDGDEVNAGEGIGLGDSTGNSSGNHLHLELKINGTFVDPMLYIGR